ncbi:hypothetical protein A0H81_06890 [Grifola frondosa]|uniref:Uncharacterized protein n=1 Tax=Grifola frondosa TaxID=5627 RepID=A0A1C7MA18_GRIFR|nr:hypothetical protein A0H81_06890 [Grifola frondosa]
MRPRVCPPVQTTSSSDPLDFQILPLDEWEHSVNPVDGDSFSYSQPSFPSQSSPSIVSSSSGYNTELDPIFAFLTELHPQDLPPLDIFSQPYAFDFEWDDATKYAIDEWMASQMNEGIFDGYNYQMASSVDGDIAATIATLSIPSCIKSKHFVHLGPHSSSSATSPRNTVPHGSEVPQPAHL